MNKVINFMLISCLGMTTAIASNNYFTCGINTFVYPGDSIDKVIASCGQPISRNDYLQKNVTKQRQTTWHYIYNKMNSFNYEAAPNVSEMNVIFADGEVISLNLSKQRSIGQSVTCGYSSNNARTINIGDSYEDVRLKCGMPRYVSNDTREVVGPDAQVSELIYSKGQFMPPATLTFKDGILVNVR